jgi:quercetin dioxygenase-like cupin family protein
MRIEFLPDFDVARHTHPGPEASYVLEGEVTYLLDGQPPESRKAGGSMFLSADAIHGARIGPKGAVLLGSYVLRKGQPLMTPAPAAANAGDKR